MDMGIEIKKIENQTFHLVNPNDEKSLALFNKVYDGLYVDSFPIDEEREPKEVMLESMKNPEGVALVFAVVGDNLDSDTPTIKGLSVGYYYQDQDVGLMGYLATASEFRNQGLGRLQTEVLGHTMLDRAQKNNGILKGYFIEVNDPEKVKAKDDNFDPALRLKIYQKWGSKILPIDYVQPPLDFGADKYGALKLLSHPHPVTREYASTDAVRGYIRGIYTECQEYAGCLPTENPDFIKSMKQLDKIDAQAEISIKKETPIIPAVLKR